MGKNKSKKGDRKSKFESYMNANRHGEWQGRFENETGFVSMHKVHKDKKAYSRKAKHKKFDA